jgi:hypothetical protein
LCGPSTHQTGCGTVFELAPNKKGAWKKTVLYNFSGADGYFPSPGALDQGLPQGLGAPGARLAFDGNGALYGTTIGGGGDDSQPGLEGGTVFQLAPPATAGGAWTETVLYNLPGGKSAPRTPLGGLFVSPTGVVFGTAYTSHLTSGYKNEDGGTVFALTPSTTPGDAWPENTLFNFWPLSSLGGGPQAGVVSVGGSLYGTTSQHGCGGVYQLSPPADESGAWAATIIYSLVDGAAAQTDACIPLAPPTVGPGGVLYGTTITGGGSAACLPLAAFELPGCGTVFQLTPPATAGGAWMETVIYSFTGTGGDGLYPAAGVVLGSGGVLYGTTMYGGRAISGYACTNHEGGGAGVPVGCGTVFQLTPPAAGGAWTETILHSFTGNDGEGSIPGPLTMNADGVLFGPTFSFSSKTGSGTIFSVTP